jgi:hypothetical protein
VCSFFPGAGRLIGDQCAVRLSELEPALRTLPDVTRQADVRLRAAAVAVVLPPDHACLVISAKCRLACACGICETAI